MLRNEGMEPISFSSGSRSAATSRTSCPSRSTTSRSATPSTRNRCRLRSSRRYDDENNQFVLADPEDGRAHAGDPLAARRRRTGAGSATRSSWSRAETWDLQLDVVPSIDGQRGRAEARRAALRRRARARAGLARRVAAARAAAPRRVGRPRARLRPVRRPTSRSLRMRSATDPGKGRLPAAGMPWFMTVFGRDTIITCLQTLLFGPELASTALERARRAPGARGRPVDRRRAGEDRPRGAHRQGGEALVPDVLRHRRRDAALPRPALRGLALDGRHLAHARAEGARASRARVDRQVGRPRRRRLRRVPAPQRPRAREPVVEGLGRLAALRRRPHRADPDRAGRGAGVRLRREAAHGGARARGLARPGARRPAEPGGEGASRALRRGVLGRGDTAATTRSRSTATSSASTRAARTWAICSGAASSTRTASTPSSTR